MMHIEKKFIQALHVFRHHRHRASHEPIHEVYQSSTINVLLEGIYDGAMTYGQLRQHGDFGIGTFNALDGEMIGFDGRFWQIKGGRVCPCCAGPGSNAVRQCAFFQPTHYAGARWPA